MEVRNYCTDLYGNWLPGMRKPCGADGLQRSENTLSGSDSGMGYAEKRALDAGSDHQQFREEGVVALPIRTLLSNVALGQNIAQL